MSDKIDVSGDKRTDWDKEIEHGHLLRQDPTRSNRQTQGEHIQGVPLKESDRTERVMSLEEHKRRMEKIQATGAKAYRPEESKAGPLHFGPPPGGWTTTSGWPGDRPRSPGF